MFLWPRKELLKKHRSNLHAAHRMLLRPCPYVISIWILKLGFSLNLVSAIKGVCLCYFPCSATGLFGDLILLWYYSPIRFTLTGDSTTNFQSIIRGVALCLMTKDFPPSFFSHTGESDVRWKFRLIWGRKLPLLRIINGCCLEHLTKTFLTPPEGRQSSSSSSAPT